MCVELCIGVIVCNILINYNELKDIYVYNFFSSC